MITLSSMENSSLICPPTSALQTPPNKMVDHNFHHHPRPGLSHRFRHRLRLIHLRLPHRTRLSIIRSAYHRPLDPPALWSRLMERQTIPIVTALALPISARLKTVKVDYPLDGSVGRITWVELTLWITTPVPPPGRDPRTTIMNKRSARRSVRPTCS